MKLYEIYEDAINENHVWKRLGELLSHNEPLDEGLDGGLIKLLSVSKKLVFNKFSIKPEQRVYFIAGSSRLYLYPDLIAELNKRDSENFKLHAGDLDIIIPNDMLWRNAGLENELKSDGIYKPTGDDTIEVFDEWRPDKVEGFENSDFRTQSEIFKDLEYIDGYWFMNLKDVLDYKNVLSRPKEAEVAKLIKQYEDRDLSNITKEERFGFISKVADIIAGKYEKTRLIQKNN
jgi:hypothetical protein